MRSTTGWWQIPRSRRAIQTGGERVWDWGNATLAAPNRATRTSILTTVESELTTWDRLGLAVCGAFAEAVPVLQIVKHLDVIEAAEVRLRAISVRPKKGSPETVATYRFHLARLRWYCDNIAGKLPSQWAMPDVTAFFEFLSALPAWAVCAQDGARFARADAPGYTPFRCQPSASSRSDIQRCIHAMFRAWREVGYIAMNPMGFHGAGTQRKVNADRAISLDLYDLVLENMESEKKQSFEQRQRFVRDRFVLNALRELGLRTTEYIKASMGAFKRLSVPKSGHTYWILHIEAETAKGQVERKFR